jgi:membrane fusion protein, heavy metal efflux system
MLKSLYKLFFIAALFLAACSDEKTAEAPAEEEAHDPDVVELTPEQYKTANVQTGNVLSINLSDYIKASGTIDAPPEQTVSITSPYGGVIKTTSVLPGKAIRKGQVVAVLENPEFIQIQQDYMESSSQLSFLSQDLTRQEELVRENIAAAKSLQRARSEYNTMMARVEGLKSKLRLIGLNPGNVRSGNFTSSVNIYASTSGYITNVYSNVGKFVGANEVIADIVNTNNLLVSVKVFEKDLPKIRVGQKIRFRGTGDSVERVAQVFLIGKDIDADRTVEVHGRVSASGQAVIPGLFVNAIIETGTAATPAVPAEAVVQAGGKNYIFILEEGEEEKAADSTKAKGKEAEENHIAFRRIEVNVGVTENGYTAVILPASFNEKSKVVIKGAYDLLSKMNNSEEEEGH